MRSGPAPKPTNLRIIEGNPGKLSLNKREPKPVPTKPSAPKFLSPAAKYEWRRVATELHRLGLLTGIDRATLAAYCQAYADWKAAVEFIKEHGSVYKVLDSKERVVAVKPYPQVVIARNASEQIRKLAAEFGMTPAARSRISLPEDLEDDAFF